ncbi:MAG: nucleotide exchange factor GrpE [Parcubacteria group bacterium]|nr:nucleotide exchange factor GrpE [Parcubacteria group bacterium]
MPKGKKDKGNIDNTLETGHNDVVFEEEDVSPKDTVAKLRRRLADCQKEKQEYLDGWQRARADAMNEKKDWLSLSERIKDKAIDEILFSLVPALDSLDSAMQGGAWDSVDESWKTGITHVHTQFLNTLLQYGIETIGEVGEEFDPTLHESMSTEDTDGVGVNNSVVKVLQRGYKKDNNIIRPAKVVVGNSK